jgi:hypothetical protein
LVLRPLQQGVGKLKDGQGRHVEGLEAWINDQPDALAHVRIHIQQ